MDSCAIEEECCTIWIAVSAHPNREPTARQHLRNQGYSSFRMIPLPDRALAHGRGSRNDNRFG